MVTVEPGTPVYVQVMVWGAPRFQLSPPFGATTVSTALLTVSLTALEALLPRLASPLYAAVRECVPMVRLDTTTCAFPAETGEVVSTVEPSLNVTEPSESTRVEGDFGVTVAVRVTALPRTEGFGEEARAVDVPAWLTVSVTAP